MILKRRPSTIEDLHESLGINRRELIKIIDSLLYKGEVRKERVGRGIFYRTL